MMHRQIGAFSTALFIHVAILLFGGLVLFHPKQHGPAVTREVELFSDSKTEAKRQEPPKEQAPTEQLAQQAEQLPDARLLAKVEAPSAANDAPALEPLSLSALESALNPDLAAAGGAFGESARLSSGGRIGGTGVAGVENSLEQILSVTELDQKPRPIFQIAPNYPADLRKKRVAGTVYVVFLVDKQGRVLSPKVEQSTLAAFEQPALQAVKQWKFEAGTKNGQKVQFKMRVPITFSPA